MIEIHGMKDCPFAWRVRATASEKALAFDWIPFDVADPDPRARQRNPERKSPKLVDDGFEITESTVIMAYLDEAYPGRPLQALGARERAHMRLRLRQLAKLEAHVTPEHPADENVRRRVSEGYEQLDQLLKERGPWLGGAEPDLSDVATWPFLWLLEEAGLRIPDRLPRATVYWRLARARESLAATRPR